VTDEGAGSPAPTAEDVWASPARPSVALQRAIGPVGRDEFFARYWEREPLVVERGEAARFTDLLTPSDVERAISETAIRTPGFRLVKAGARIDQRGYTANLPWKPAPFTGTVDVDRVLEEWRNGATIVLQALHVNWSPLARYCRLLETELGHPVQANAYYTPRSAQGFPVHHDTHDVFVLQIAGKKRWLVYEPVWALPLRGQPYSEKVQGSPGSPRELVLRAGDTLYLPRGWLHEAATSESDSLHLTIGVNVYTWLDAVRAAVDECRNDVEFRRGVPRISSSACGAGSSRTRSRRG
jgi:ribosomal protein L16 Arg81 hydroxylase